MKLTTLGLREAMHDDFGPRLFSIATKLTLLKGQLSGKHRAQAAAILKDVEALRRQFRQIAEGRTEASPPDLHQALKRLAREVKGAYQNDLERPITDSRTVECLYRIACEAARNAVRHGGGRRIMIRLAAGVLRIEDSGSGLAPGWRPGVGMNLMKRRARRLGGRLTLQRVPPGATILACHFPPSAE